MRIRQDTYSAPAYRILAGRVCALFFLVMFGSPSYGQTAPYFGAPRWNLGLVRRCRITNHRWRVESFVVFAYKRRRAGLICRGTHSELFHTAAGLYLEQQRSAAELCFLKQRYFL